MLTLPSTCACAFVCGGCGLSSALHAGPPASHRVVLMLASLEECGTADAHSTPGRHGLTMPRISDRFDPGGSERRSSSGLARLAFGCASPSAPDPPPLVGERAPLAFDFCCLCVSSRGRD